MSEIDLRLLGGFEARAPSGASLSFPTRKTQALLAYLAVRPGRRYPRSKIANLLWADHGDEPAKANLRQTLSYLRKALAEAGRSLLLVENDTIAIDPEGVSVDTADLEELAAQDSLNALERAVGLFRGDLLKGFDLREEEFNDWLRAERARLRDLGMGTMKRLLTAYVAQEAWAKACPVANRLIEIDPLQEDVHRTLMQIHLCRGARVQALQQYEICKSTLLRAFDIEPETETRQLYEAARNGDHSGDAPRQRTSDIAAHPVSKRPRVVRSLSIFFGAISVIALVGIVAIRVDRNPTSETALVADAPEATEAIYPLPTSRQGTAIVVLPFRNLAADSDDAFFAEALTNSVITELSRFRDLFVIARQTSQQYMAAPRDLRKIGSELSVQYVLEGSVQQSGEQIRVTVQLVDTGTGRHAWANRYAEPLTDLFEIQDDITRQIAAALGAISGAVKSSELSRSVAKSPQRLKAYDHFLRGLRYIERLTREDVALGKKHMKNAIELDPSFAKPYAKLAIASWLDWAMGVAPRDEAFAMIQDYADAAIRIDGNEPWAYWALGYVYLHKERNFAEALQAFEKSLELNPNDADVLSEYGWALAFAGRAQEGVARMREAIRLNPFHPQWYLNNLSVGYLLGHDYENVISTLSRMTALSTAERMYLAASYARLGRLDEARSEVAAALESRPDFELGTWLETRPFARPEDRDYFAESLKLAGVPE